MYALGEIYWNITSAMYFEGGSAAIAQFVVCPFMKARGMELAPWNKETKINPDILAMFSDQQEFASMFADFMDIPNRAKSQKFVEL